MSTEKKVIETEKKFSEGRKVVLNNVVVKSVSTPASIARIAQDKGINPQEVFVRVKFEYNGKEYVASNKLRYLTKSGYKELLDAEELGTKLDISVDVDNGFFSIEKNVSIDDLFKDDTKEEKKSAFDGLAALLG